MEEILVIAFQLFFEFFIQIVGSGILDGRSRGTNGKNDGCFIFGLHIFVGGGLGWISTLIVPQLFLPFLWMRLANFVVAPLVAGGISYAFATWAKSRGNNHDPAGHFLHGCLFALMFGVARYAFAVR